MRVVRTDTAHTSTRLPDGISFRLDSAAFLSASSWFDFLFHDHAIFEMFDTPHLEHACTNMCLCVRERQRTDLLFGTCLLLLLPEMTTHDS